MYLRRRIDLGVFGVGLTLSPKDRFNPNRERTIFVAAPNAGKILQVFPREKTYEVFISGYEDCMPIDLTFDPYDSDLYVTCFNNDSVIHFDGVTGDYIETFVTD